MLALTGLPFLGVLTLLVILVVATAVRTWPRARWQFVRRWALLLIAEALVVLIGVVWVNRTQDFYASWGELLGHEAAPVVTPIHRSPAALARESRYIPIDPSRSPAAVTAWARDVERDWHSQGSHGSLVVSFPLTGPRTHYTLPTAVYLPAAFFHRRPGRRFPVVEVFPGYPGGPQDWLVDLAARHYLDQSIDSGVLPPTIAVFVSPDPFPGHDSECVNSASGVHAGTYLTTDVPAVVSRLLPVLASPRSWATLGYATGGFCALHAALTAPYRYGAAVSLSGYLRPVQDAATGDLLGRHGLKRFDSVAWLLAHRPVPRLDLLLGAGSSDAAAMNALHGLIRILPPAVATTTAIVPGGGRNARVWRALEPTVWRWLGQHLLEPGFVARKGGPIRLPT